MEENKDEALDFLRSLVREYRKQGPELTEEFVETDMTRLVSLDIFPTDDKNSTRSLRANALEMQALGTLATSTISLEEQIEITESEYERYAELEDEELIADSASELEDILRSVLLADNLYLFFTLCAGLVESISVELIDDRLMSDEHQGASSTLGFIEGLSQSQRNELLFRSGIIDSGLKGELDRIRKIRNSLTHEVRERYLHNSIEDLEEEINRGVRAVNELHGHYNDIKPLGWVKED